MGLRDLGFGRDSIQYRVGKTHCQGHQDPSLSKRVPIFLGTPEANFECQDGSHLSGSHSAVTYCTSLNFPGRHCNKLCLTLSQEDRGGGETKPGPMDGGGAATHPGHRNRAREVGRNERVETDEARAQEEMHRRHPNADQRKRH